MSFDLYNVTPNASINRVKLMSAPGLPEAWRGKTAYQVMGREGLVQRIGAAFPELANQADPIPVFCEQYLAQKNPVSEALAQEMGQALGCLLLTLKLGEDANRMARPEWDNSYWAQWGSIQNVILGGGIMAGLLGRIMFERATAMVNGLMSLSIAEYPAALPLIGAACMAIQSNEDGWVFDFGGTNIKRAWAIYKQDMLVGLEQLSSIFIPVFNKADDLFKFMVQTIVSTLSKVEVDSRSINASIANYVRGCQLAPDTSYGRLSTLDENFCQLLSKVVSQNIGYHVNMALVHDGTAAAKVYAGAIDTVVVTIGTALGMGFPPPQQSVKPLSKDFHIRFTGA